MSNIQPRISIGLPVYNGENFLKEAIDSILTQTFEYFELIISDNASTDKTEEICREYATKDKRIRYYRNEQNLGPTLNYNRVFELATGEYFKWQAHDDICAPEFLERCIEVLDKEPSVILCHSKVKLIDEYGKDLKSDDYHVKISDITLNTDSLKPDERFREILFGDNSFYAIFGLIRSNILRKTPLLGAYTNGDGILLIRLALLGRFHEVPEYLFFYRDHEQQSVKIAYTNVSLYTAWFDPKKVGKITFPRWRNLLEYCVSLWNAPLSWQEQIKCWLAMIIWVFKRQNLLTEDLIVAGKKYLKHFAINLYKRFPSSPSKA